MLTSKKSSREVIGRKVRELRVARRWTQAELAKELRLSQARLSEVERGAGSFTAEQFLQILRLFNAAVTDFDPATPRDQTAELQNALARHGAVELQESEQVLPSVQLQNLHTAIRETLVVGTPRLLAALGPVLVNHIDRISLRRLYVDLSTFGFERRLAWLVESVRDAVAGQLAPPPSASWSRRYRRTLLVLEEFLKFVEQWANPQAPAHDVLDMDILSKRSLERVQLSSSETSRRWGIITSLQLSDFSVALQSARVEG